MGLFRMIYSSQPFGYDDAMLSGILLDARRCNARDGLTGALLCRRDVYLQLIEGEEDAVRAAIARIGRDDRHMDLVVHVAGPVAGRLFGDWAMLHDPAASWFGPVADGDGLAHVRATDVVPVFEALAARGAAPG
jgi:hypothetical protein